MLPVRVFGDLPSPDDPGLAETFGRSDLVPVASVGPDALLSLNDPRAQAAAIPGGGGVARATDMALVYQRFLPDHDSPLPANWRSDAIGTVRNISIGATDGVPANRTIAGQVSGRDAYRDHRWMPQLPNVFGHAGAGGQLCWVDRDSGCSFSFLHDTLHADPRADFVRCRAINAAAVTAITSLD